MNPRFIVHDKVGRTWEFGSEAKMLGAIALWSVGYAVYYRDDYVAKLKSELAALRLACARENEETCQVLGAALGYPRFCDDQASFPRATESDGVCVGEHVAVTLATEAAGRIGTLAAENAKLRQACEGLLAERDRAIDMAISVSNVQRSDAIQHRWVTIYSVLGREFREQGDARAFALNWLRTSTFPVSAPATAGEGGGAK